LQNWYPISRTGGGFTYVKTGKGPIASGMYNSKDEHFIYYHLNEAELDANGTLQTLSVRRQSFVAATPQNTSRSSKLVLGPLSIMNTRNIFWGESVWDPYSLFLNLILGKTAILHVRLYVNNRALASATLSGPINSVKKEIKLVKRRQWTPRSSKLRGKSQYITVKIEMHGECEIFGYLIL